MLAVYLMVNCIWVINAAFQQIKQISLSAQLLLALTLVFMSLGSDVGVRPARPGKWSGEKEAYPQSPLLCLCHPVGFMFPATRKQAKTAVRLIYLGKTAPNTKADLSAI